jgi:hypothetical protein
VLGGPPGPAGARRAPGARRRCRGCGHGSGGAVGRARRRSASAGTAGATPRRGSRRLPPPARGRVGGLVVWLVRGDQPLAAHRWPVPGRRRPRPCAGSRAPHAGPGPHDATGAAPRVRRWWGRRCAGRLQVGALGPLTDRGLGQGQRTGDLAARLAGGADQLDHFSPCTPAGRTVGGGIGLPSRGQGLTLGVHQAGSTPVRSSGRAPLCWVASASISACSYSHAAVRSEVRRSRLQLSRPASAPTARSTNNPQWQVKPLSAGGPSRS